MNKIDQIKDAVARKHGFSDWLDLTTQYRLGLNFSYSKFNSYLDECIEEVANAQREACAENAKVIVGNLLETKPYNKYFFNMKNNLFVEADKDSIINTPLITHK